MAYTKAWRRVEFKIDKFTEAKTRWWLLGARRRGKWGDVGQGAQSFSIEDE